MSYTKGPWDEHAIKSALRAIHKSVSHIPYEDTREGFAFPDEQDAPLIAAAPDLYEELEKLEWSGPNKNMGDQGFSNGSCPCCGFVREQNCHSNDCSLNLSLAKAKGEL